VPVAQQGRAATGCLVEDARAHLGKERKRRLARDSRSRLRVVPLENPVHDLAVVALLDVLPDRFERGESEHVAHVITIRAADEEVVA
jgi:hypothetical protein